MFGVVVLLLSESVAGILTAVGPEYLGLQLDRDALGQVWQSSYGVPGKEQYTVAIDLIQVQVSRITVKFSKKMVIYRKFK